MVNTEGSHAFLIEDAIQYGLNAAALLNNIRFWVNHNEAQEVETHYHNGKYWMYNSKKAFAKLMPYLSESQVKHALKKLLDFGAIESGNFNKKGYDKTLWYSLQTPANSYNPLQPSLDKIVQPLGENVQPLDKFIQPIPIVNTTINTIKKEIVNKSSPNKSVVIKDKKSLPEKQLEKKGKKVDKPNSVKDIMDKQENAVEARLEELEYLKDLKPYQLMNPKEFKGSKHKGKMLTRIATDTYTLFTHTCKKVNPDMGIVITPTMKDVAMMGSFMKKIGGDIELLLLIANNWFTFKTAVEAQHATKIKKKYPNLPIMVMYAEVASSEGFLGKLAEHSPEEASGLDWDDI